MALAPDIPTFRELGLPSISFSDWFGLFAPGGTSRDVVAKINAAAVEALADPTVQSRFVELGQEIFSRDRQTPASLGEIAKADAENGGRSSRNWASEQSEPDHTYGSSSVMTTPTRAKLSVCFRSRRTSD
jgi:tripartite-type tricarboxylate transporter receptor subunit TctC